MERVLMFEEQEYKNLQAVASMLTATSKNGYIYQVENVYLDFGQDWMWTTIVAYNLKDDSITGSWQVLSPAEWKDVVLADGAVELMNAVQEIKAGKWFKD